MAIDNKVLRNVIKLILETDEVDDEEVEFTTDDGKRATKSSGRVPRGPHEYRTATGEIVTIPDYANPPKMSSPFKWSDDAGESGQTAQGTTTAREEAVRSDKVISSMISSGNKRISKKYNLQQSQAGDRPDPATTSTKSYHAGIDIVRMTGETAGIEVVAAMGGTVVKVVTGQSNDLLKGGYGNQIVIKHDDGTGTRYGHLSIVIPTMGTPNNPTKVNAGSTIGYAGDTGKSTGPHLHFEHITGFDRNNEPNGTKDPDSLLRTSGVFYPLMAEITS